MQNTIWNPTIDEMKLILAQKFEDEECCFTQEDITIEEQDNGLKIIIKDFEHCPISISKEKDDYFGYVLYVKDECEEEIIGMYNSRRDYPYTEALINIGYYIASRF